MRAPSYHKSFFSQKPWLAYLQLMRLHRPVGWLLLLWPTLMALWGASRGKPSGFLIVVFTLGVIVMRSAGCVINDWADRHVDGHVKRTRERPLVSGKVQEKEALWLFSGLILFAFLLVCMLNLMTLKLSVIALALAATYPFMKRYTHFPQVVLGAAFGWGIPMAYAAQSESVPLEAWILFSAMLLWTVAFDTIYAMVDKDDDLKIGVKSTAIGFGKFDKFAVASLQGGALVLFGLWGVSTGLGMFYATGWLTAFALSIYQQWRIQSRDPATCFKAFLNNQWIGLALFIGMWLDFCRA